MNVTPLAEPEELAACVSHFMQTAYLASELYKAMVGSGLPPDLSADLTRDWHAQAIAGTPFDED